MRLLVVLGALGFLGTALVTLASFRSDASPCAVTTQQVTSAARRQRLLRMSTADRKQDVTYGASSNCSVNLYADGPPTYEFRFLMDHIAQVPALCGCSMYTFPRNDFINHMNASTLPFSVALLLATGGTSPAEKNALQLRPIVARQRVILFYLSDEKCLYPGDTYADVAVVYRNYLCKNVKARIDYLLPNAATRANDTAPSLADDSGHVYWFPLGYAKGYLRFPAMLAPTNKRRWLFSWAGSIDDKKERRSMIESVRKWESGKTLALGSLHTVGGFNSGEYLKQEDLSLWYYNSKIIPVPAGINPEQFRIWEALDAGCILLVKPGVPNLQFLDFLDFKYLPLPDGDWSKAGESLWNISQNATLLSELNAWQAHNLQAWQTTLSKFQAHVATQACALVTRQRS